METIQTPKRIRRSRTYAQQSSVHRVLKLMQVWKGQQPVQTWDLYNLTRQPIFRAAALGRARVLWHQVQQKLPCFGYAAFDTIFVDWERVKTNDFCSAQALQNRLITNLDRLVLSPEDALAVPGAVFQEIRRLKAGRALMEWCSFEYFNSAWQGCVRSLDKQVSDFKFVSDVIVVFQFNTKWVVNCKLHAYVSTAQWTGFRYNCAQSFAVTVPPHGFDEKGQVLPNPKLFFDCIVRMAREILVERRQASLEKEAARDARQLARKQAQLDSAANTNKK